MARITHVTKAQQRYATVPVIDPDTGEQKNTTVLNRDGTPKTTKRGKTVLRRLTRADHAQPLPNHTCGKCLQDIEVGQPYKHISPKSGPYGGRTLYRCDSCPAWHRWEYNNSLSAQIEQIAHEAETAIADVDSTDDATQVYADAAESVRGLAEEKRESAQNIVDGFGHDTYQSEELESQADELESWADEIDSTEVPKYPEPEEDDCYECDGAGEVDAEGIPSTEGDGDMSTCPVCSGAQTFTPEEPTEEQMDEWRAEVEESSAVLGNSPG